MEKTFAHQFIPENTTGKALDLIETVTESSLEEAVATFKRASSRLQNPPLWHQLSGAELSANFELKDGDDTSPQRLVNVNDFIRIDIPGPGPVAGNGYDWVQVKALSKNVAGDADESLGLMLAAVAHPQKKSLNVAHFFREGATSSFIIKRTGKTVTASYHGRNEQPNTVDVGVADKLRNAVVAAGAMSGLSKLQWTALIKGFLKKEIGG